MAKLDKDLEKALYKKALGYTQKETVEEYSKVDDDVVLNKRKVTKKDVPPDISAIKVLLQYKEIDDKDIKSMTTAELYNEREKLKRLLESIEENDDDIKQDNKEN